MQRRTASYLLFALLIGAMHGHAERMRVHVVQTHTGVKLGTSSSADPDDTDATWTRCSGESGTYAKDRGFYCHDSVVPVDVGTGDSSLFFDISVIMPNAARLVFHCSTILDTSCEGFPDYPPSASVVCSDFVHDGQVYKDCTATGASPEGIGVYQAALHGDRMTIFGGRWHRHYLKYGTWEYPDPPAQDLKAATGHAPTPPVGVDGDPAPAQDTKVSVAQEPTPPAPQEEKPAAAPETKPALPQESKPAPDAPSTPQPDHAPAAAPSPAATADEAIDPSIIEQAKAGDMVSQYKLGYDYFQGKGVPLDYVQAAIWWRKAADQGYPDAQNNLGVLYNAGKGVPQSYAEAYFWENLAAARARGFWQAQFAKNRDESASKLWFIARLRVQQRAAKWAAEHPVPPRSQEPREAQKQ